jgi:hypothetical protein
VRSKFGNDEIGHARVALRWIDRGPPIKPDHDGLRSSAPYFQSF